MNKTEIFHSHLNDTNYLNLERHYKVYPIALYTGAGVSWSTDKNFGLRGWNDFVKKVLVSDENNDSATLEEFEQSIDRKWADEPWLTAEWVAKRIGRKVFERNVMKIVQREENFQKKYKLLSGRFLRNAPTLNSVVAFCADFAGGRRVEGKKGKSVAVYKPSVNHRVRAVVTSNYDPFLEAASSTMFRKPILKPVGAKGSSVGALHQIPVYHIHGYVPFPHKFSKRKADPPIPLVDPVVTKGDYEAAWKTDNVFNFTMGPQIHVLRHYTTLFIGFSFRDYKVNELLKDLNKERESRSDRLYHYALLKGDEIQSMGLDFYHSLGVKPICLKDFSEIPKILSSLYQQGLIHDHGDMKIQLPLVKGREEMQQAEPVYLAAEQYFDQLCACRLCTVWR